MKYDYLIVGAGLYGSVFAREMTDAGKKCLVIDSRSHIGGNIYCQDVEGVCVHRYGAHIFHTADEEVWQYVNRFVTFNNYINSPVAVNGDLVLNMPFNMNTFSRLWGVRTPAEAKAKIAEQTAPYRDIEPANLEEQALKLVGRDIYEKLVRDYTMKQWGRKCTELPAFIIRRLPLRFTYDNNYFTHPHQGIPIEGYNTLAERLLAESGVKPAVLGTSCKFHTPELAEAALTEGECSIRIAKRLGIPFIRVFGNNIVGDREACIAYTAEGIARLCAIAAEYGVTVLLEVHGDFNTAEALLPVIEAAEGMPFGLIWDIGHTHAPYGNDWKRFYNAVRPYIRHVHIKDKAAEKLVLPGDGEIPIREIAKRMAADGYDGYFSLEWEKKWHPELPALETALERFMAVMKG